MFTCICSEFVDTGGSALSFVCFEVCFVLVCLRVVFVDCLMRLMVVVILLFTYYLLFVYCDLLDLLWFDCFGLIWGFIV